MNIKQIIAVLLAASMLASFSACGKKKTSNTGTSAAYEQTGSEAVAGTETPTGTGGQAGNQNAIEDGPDSEFAMPLVYNDEGAPCAHEKLTLAITPATCTEGSSGSYVCADCGAVLHSVQTEAKGHRYVYASDANGHWRECVVCGDKTASEAHTFGADSVCTVCGYGCEHRFTDTVTAPTCLEPGYTTHVCDKCGYQTIDSYTAPVGHSYVGTVIKAATCTEPGEGVYTCSACGDSFTAALPAAGHHAVNDPSETATCQSAGLSAGSHCDICGEVLVPQEVLPVTDHVFVDGVCVWCGTKATSDDNSGGGVWELPPIPA